jgi:hypothetical protein
MSCECTVLNSLSLSLQTLDTKERVFIDSSENSHRVADVLKQWKSVTSSARRHREQAPVRSQVFESVTNKFIEATWFLKGKSAIGDCSTSLK